MSQVKDHSLLLEDGRILFAGRPWWFEFHEESVHLIHARPPLATYDPSTCLWRTVLPANYWLVDTRIVPLPGNRILISGVQVDTDESPYYTWNHRGLYDSSATHRFFALDVADGTLGEPSAEGIGRFEAAVVPLVDGRILVTAGTPLNATVERPSYTLETATQVYDPASDSWEDLAPINGDWIDTLNTAGNWVGFQWFGPSRSNVVGVIVGGIEEERLEGSILVYDPAADRWTIPFTFELGDYDEPWHALSLGDDIILFFEDRLEIFDPYRGTWKVSHAPRGVASHSSVTILPDGRLLIAGGHKGSSFEYGEQPDDSFFARDTYSEWPRSTTDIYDISTSVWAAGPDLASMRSNHSATLLANGNVLLFGGITIWNQESATGKATESMEYILAPTLTMVDTSKVFGAPTIQENSWELCIGAANLGFLPESSREIQETPDPFQILRQSAVAMSKLESFATTKVVLETFDDQSDTYGYRRSPICYLTQTTYEHPGRAASMQAGFEARRLSDISWEQNLWIDESAYTREFDHQLWQVEDGGFAPSSESFLPLVMWSLLTDELRSEIETELRLVGTELFDGVTVYHVRAEVVGRPPEFRNVASFWIGVDDLLLRRAHWEHPAPRRYHYPRFGFQSELTEFHSFNEDFDIQPPPDDEIDE